MAHTQTNIDERTDELFEWIAQTLVNNAIKETIDSTIENTNTDVKETHHILNREAS